MRWAKLNEIKPDDVVEVDAGFTCTMPGTATVLGDEIGLYFRCNGGKHYLHGQLNDDGELVGIYEVKRKCEAKS